VIHRIPSSLILHLLFCIFYIIVSSSRKPSTEIEERGPGCPLTSLEPPTSDRVLVLGEGFLDELDEVLDLVEGFLGELKLVLELVEGFLEELKLVLVLVELFCLLVQQPCFREYDLNAVSRP
jgi:hypothetical protein